MRIGRWAIFGEKNINKMIDTARAEMVNKIIKNGIDVSTVQGVRPSIDFFTYLTTDEGVKIPVYPLTYMDMFAVARFSDILRIVLDAIKREVFKNGFIVEEKFKWKCVSCGKEFSSLPWDKKCDKCNGDLRRPSDEQEILAKNLIEKYVNLNKQRLEDVLREVERDIDITDNGFLLVIKDYDISNDGAIISSTVKEILRVSPANMSIIADKGGRPTYKDSGEQMRVCPLHRSRPQVEPDTHCKICGTELLPCYAKANITIFGAQRVMDTKPVFYAQDEVILKSKFVPSLMYGESPIVSLWSKIVSMLWMDRYIHQYYLRQRPPKGAFLISTKNVESFKKAWEYALDRLRVNPHEIVPLAFEGTGKNAAQFIHFDLTLQEMQFKEVRDEFRRLVGACYDDKTEILTSEGWKLFKNLNRREKVLQYNKKTGNLNYITPKNWFEYDYDGEMIQYKKKSLDLLVTSNHRMLYYDDSNFYTGNYEPRVKLAENFKRGIIPQAGSWKGKRIDKVLFRNNERGSIVKFVGKRKYEMFDKYRASVKKFELDGDLFCAFMGIWLSEGSASKNGYKVQVA